MLRVSPFHSYFPFRNVSKAHFAARYFSHQIEKIDLSLYLVTDRSCVKNDAEFINRVAKAVSGGVSCVQIRDKNEDIQATLKTGCRLKEIFQATHTKLIINNRVDVALAVKADGVHLGRKDFYYSEARKLLGKKAVIGLTVETWGDVLEAQALDVDYLGVQLFPSLRTKTDSSSIWGMDEARKIKDITRHRLVFIGGITLDNVEMAAKKLGLRPGADGVAMVGELWRGKSPALVASKVKAILQKAMEGNR